MNFYIEKNKQWEEIQVEVGSNFVNPKDETVDSFAIILKANKEENPIEPRTRLKVIFDDDTIKLFTVVSDTVTIQSLHPLFYKHTINVQQNIKDLDNYLIRNNVFTQPRETTRVAFYGVSNSADISNVLTADNQPVIGFGSLSYKYYMEDEATPIEKLNHPDAGYWGGKSQSIFINKTVARSNNIYLTFDFFAAWFDEEGRGKLSEQLTVYKKHNTLGEIKSNKTSLTVLIYHSDNSYRQVTIYNPKSNIKYELYKLDPSIVTWMNSKTSGYFYVMLPSGQNNFMGKETRPATTGTGSYMVYPLFTTLHVKLHIGAKRLTMYDVIDNLLKQQKHKYQEPLFELPTEGELYDLLTTTEMPDNLTFTQCSFYSAMLEIFRMFDATFTIDENNVLGIDYYNERTDKIDGVQAVGKSKVQTQDYYSNGFVSYYQNTVIRDTYPKKSFVRVQSMSAGIPKKEDYCVKLPKRINYIENFIANIDCLYFYYQDPVTGKYINGNKNAAMFVLWADIKMENGQSTTGHNTVLGGNPNVFALPCKVQYLDLSRFIIEQSVWSTLPTGEMVSKPTFKDFFEGLVQFISDLFNLPPTTPDPPMSYGTRGISQNGSFPYSKGQNYIDIARTYETTFGIEVIVLQGALLGAMMEMACPVRIFEGGNVTMPKAKTGVTFVQTYGLAKDPFNFKDLSFKVDYLSQGEGRVKVESLANKHEGEVLTNQGNGAVDINKLGLNILGNIVKRGEPKINYTHKISKWEDRVKVGQYFYDNNEMWVCNVANYSFLGDGFIQGTLEFTKNYNEIASRVALDTQKRMSNISNDLVVTCEDDYCEYLYFDGDRNVEEPTSETWNLCLNKRCLFDTLGFTFGVGTYDYTLDYAYVDAYYLDGEEEQLIEYQNTKLFFSQYAQNRFIPILRYGSGNAICFEMAFESPISAGMSLTHFYNFDLSQEVYESSAVLYTDEEGVADRFKINLCYKPNEKPFSQVYPYVPEDHETMGEIVIDYYKKPNEIFALNYELICLPYDQNKDFICYEFIKNNGFIANENMERPLYLYYSANEFAFMDNKVRTGDIRVGSVSCLKSIESGSNRAKYTFTAYDGTTSHNVRGWAIADDKGNILYAHNFDGMLETESDQGWYEETLTVMASHKRV